MVEKTHTAGLWPQLYEPLKGLGAKVADWLAPASDASSDDEAYHITMELPGVGEEDIDVAIHDGMVTVKGEKSASREESGETWFFSERQYGSFSRSFRVPPDADGDKVAAELKDGVLTITVPKQAPKATAARKVAISKG